MCICLTVAWENPLEEKEEKGKKENERKTSSDLKLISYRVETICVARFHHGENARLPAMGAYQLLS